MKKSTAIALILTITIISVDTHAVTMQSIQEKAKAAGKKAWEHKGKIAVGTGVALGTAAALAARSKPKRPINIEEVFRKNNINFAKLSDAGKAIIRKWGQIAAMGLEALNYRFNLNDANEQEEYLNYITTTPGLSASLTEIVSYAEGKRIPTSALPGH